MFLYTIQNEQRRSAELFHTSLVFRIIRVFKRHAHPYTSCEKGSIENHNGLIRRFIRKGKRISDYSDDDILYVELWANSLPRKILGYRTPDEAFDDEMDFIYAA